MTLPIRSIVDSLTELVATRDQQRQRYRKTTERRQAATVAEAIASLALYDIYEDMAKLCRALRELTPAFGYPEIREACSEVEVDMGKREDF